MSALNPIPLIAACQIMAPKLGKQFPLARKEVVDAVNRMRLMMYNILQPHSAFSDLRYRIRTCIYNEDRRFRGFVLPRDLDAVTGVWFNDSPLSVQSEWREVYEGIMPMSTSEIDIASAGYAPTERGLLKPSTLRMYTDDDNGPAVDIRGFTAGGERTGASLKLVKNSWVTTSQVFSRIETVTLPSLKGRVILADDTGYELSRYYPGETVPSYRRYRCGDFKCVLVAGSRHFVEIFTDSEVVEVGDRLILEEAAVGLRYANAKDRAERELSLTAFGRMQALLEKVLARSRGVEQRGPVILPRKKNSLYPTRP